MRGVNDGVVKIKREKSVKQPNSTDLKHFNSLHHSVRCRVGSVMLSNPDNLAANPFGRTYWFYVLLLDVYFLLLYTSAVLLLSLLGKFWTTGSEMTHCWLSSTPTSLSIRGLQAAFWEVLWTVFTGMADPQNKTRRIQFSFLLTLASLEEVDRQPSYDRYCGCTGCISLEVIDWLSSSDNGCLFTGCTLSMFSTVSMLIRIEQRDINLIGFVKKRRV